MAADTPQISVVPGDSERHGGCNSCWPTTSGYRVYRFRVGILEFRLCGACLVVLRQTMRKIPASRAT
jgi:hypothetical protein